MNVDYYHSKAYKFLPHGFDDPAANEAYMEWVLAGTMSDAPPPVETERVEVPVWEYLQYEGVRMRHVLGNMQIGVLPPQAALAELIDSYATVLSLLSQQQLEKDLNG